MNIWIFITVVIVVVVVLCVLSGKTSQLGVKKVVGSKESGGKVRTFDRDALDYKRLQFLRSQGFNPKVIYDIGANDGVWSNAGQEIFKDATFYMFEANDEHEHMLVATGRPYIISVLGDTDKDVVFHSLAHTGTILGGKGGGDSVFEENTQWYVDNPNVNRKKLRMKRLDDIVAEKKWPQPEFIKMDVQGAELIIMKGGENALANTEIIVLETKILEYNKGAPMLLDIMNYLDSKGFAPLDILELHYIGPGYLNEVDVMFVRKTSPLLKKGLLG